MLAGIVTPSLAMVLDMLGTALYRGDVTAAEPPSFPTYLLCGVVAAVFGGPLSVPVALAVRLDNSWRAVPYIAVLAAFGVELQMQLGRAYEENYLVSFVLMLVWVFPAIIGTLAALLLKWQERAASVSIAVITTAAFIVFAIHGSARARELAPAYSAAEVWSQIRVGMNVFTGDEGSAPGQTVRPTLAMILDDQTPGRCRHVSPGTAAIIDAIFPCKKTDSDWGYESPHVRIHAVDGSWAGFADAAMLQPDIPAGTLIEMTGDWQDPLVMNSDRVGQTVINDEALVQVLRYDPKRDMSLYVRILDGADSGQTGWMYIQSAETGGVALGEYSLQYQDCANPWWQELW